MDKALKRGGMVNIAARNRHKAGSKDATSAGDQNAQFCNRIGCNGRIKYGNLNGKIGGSDKEKCSKLLSCSSNKNEMAGKSSRRGSVMTREMGLSLFSKRKLESAPSGSSESGDAEVASQGRSPASHQSGSRNTSRGTKTEGSSGTSTSRFRKLFQHKLGSNKQNTEAASSASKNPGLGMANSSNKGRSPKNQVPPNGSSSGSQSVAKNVTKKRSPEEDSSLSRNGRYMSASGPSISACRRSRSCTYQEDNNGDASSRTGRSTYPNQNRMRLSSYQQNGRNGREPRLHPVSEPRPIRADIPSYNMPGSSSSSSSSSSSRSSSSSLSNYSEGNAHDMPYSPEFIFGQLMSQATSLGFNRTDGRVVDVLSALEDEEMTEEQILALEASFYLSRFNLYDQHQDMRLDIDNMSYEELLALGERMGTVSTALSEDELLKCVRRSVYQVTTPPEERHTGSGVDGDDIKCSICQEEYATGDELGQLVECEHVYHMTCLNQWLHVKNWCPICKAAAAPTESSSSSSSS